MPIRMITPSSTMTLTVVFVTSKRKHDTHQAERNTEKNDQRVHEGLELRRHHQVHQEHGKCERESETVVRSAQFFVLSAELHGHLGRKLGAKRCSLRTDFVRNGRKVAARKVRRDDSRALRPDPPYLAWAAADDTSAMEPSRIGTPRGPSVQSRRRWRRRLRATLAGGARLLLLVLRRGRLRRFQTARVFVGSEH